MVFCSYILVFVDVLNLSVVLRDVELDAFAATIAFTVDDVPGDGSY